MGITVSPDTGTTFESGAAEYIVVKALDTNNFVVAYRDGNDSNKGKAVVGTRIGTSITVSESDITTFETNEVQYIDMCVMSSALIVISYRNASSGKLEVIAGSISGTTITFGSKVNPGTYTVGSETALAALDSTYFVLSFGYSTAEYFYPCSISGTTITVGTLSSFNTYAAVSKATSTRLDSTHFASAFRVDQGIWAKVGEVNTGALTISLGSDCAIEAFNGGMEPNWVKVDLFDSLHFVIIYDKSSNGVGYIRACSVNPTTLIVTPGTAVNLAGAPNAHISICTMDSTHFLCAYNYGADQGYLAAGSLSGSTTLTMDAEGQINFDTDTITYTGVCNLDGEFFLIGFKED